MKKLSLKHLKVKSFITEAKEMNDGTVKGGRSSIEPIETTTSDETIYVTPCTICFNCPQDKTFM